MSHANFLDAGTQYCFGFFGINAIAMLQTGNVWEALPWSVIVPAVVLLVVNIPKMLREWMNFYRDYKDPQRNISRKDRAAARD